jgi:hypothetical protein
MGAYKLAVMVRESQFVVILDTLRCLPGEDWKVCYDGGGYDFFYFNYQYDPYVALNVLLI